jgi:creatinine amidohydrolase
MTWEQARDVIEAGAWALIPCGATEAHGPHLPLCTDVVISEEGAVRAARRLEEEGVRAVVLPPVAYAVTEYASEFPGTVSIRPSTARALLLDVVAGAVRSGFRGAVLCNAHLEPQAVEAIAGAVEDARAAGLRAAFPDVTRKPHALRLGEEFKSGACHAGSYETSLVLAAEPFLVHEELQLGLEPNPISLSRAIRDGKKTFLEAGGPRAYFGDPAAATAAEGDQLFHELADIFASAVKALAAEG